MSDLPITPSQVERRLFDLSKEIDGNQRQLEITEKAYFETKAQYEISLAKVRLAYASKSAPNGKNYTIQEREDLALVENEDLHFQLAALEATIRAVRQNAKRLETQADITRSVGASVRTEMKI